MTSRKNIFVFEDDNLDIAYLLGYYLTDGYVKRPSDENAYFRAKSIDLDIAQNLVDITYRMFGKTPAISKQRNGGKSKGHHYELCIYSATLCDWLEDVTNKKMTVPEFVYTQSMEWKREFLAGLIDGDGWCSVSLRRKKNAPNGNASWYSNIGLCGMKNSYMLGMRRFFDHMGIQYSYYETVTKMGTSMRHYTIQTRSFVENKLYFKCKRKEEKANIIRRENIGCKYRSRNTSDVQRLNAQSLM